MAASGDVHSEWSPEAADFERAIRAWVESLGPSNVKYSQKGYRFETLLDINPGANDAIGIGLLIEHRTGICEAYVGGCFRLGEMSGLHASLLLCEAVRCGRVVESRREFLWCIVEHSVEVHTADKVLFDRCIHSFIGSRFGLGRTRTLCYAPWS